MPAKYRFVTNGSLIEFYDDAMLVTSFQTDYTGFNWRYDDTEGISFSFIGNEYQTDDVSDISFDGVTLASKQGFKAALGALFPHYSSSGEHGIYGGDGTLPSDVIVDTDGH